MLDIDATLDRLLARSDAYRFVAAGFRDPDGPLPAALEAQPLASAARSLGRPLDPRRRRAIRSLIERDHRATEHRQIFGHVVAHGCPPYETEYGRHHLFGQAQELADIAGFYAAVGLRPGPTSERPDHLACELEFLAVVALKEARALARGEEELAARARAIAATFLRDHVGRWAPAFAQLVEQRAPGSGYSALAAITAELIADHAADAGVTPVTLGPRLRPLPGPPEGLDVECGTPEAVPGPFVPELEPISAGDGETR